MPQSLLYQLADRGADGNTYYDWHKKEQMEISSFKGICCPLLKIESILKDVAQNKPTLNATGSMSRPTKVGPVKGMPLLSNHHTGSSHRCKTLLSNQCYLAIDSKACDGHKDDQQLQRDQPIRTPRPTLPVASEEDFGLETVESCIDWVDRTSFLCHLRHTTCSYRVQAPLYRKRRADPRRPSPPYYRPGRVLHRAPTRSVRWHGVRCVPQRLRPPYQMEG